MATAAPAAPAAGDIPAGGGKGSKKKLLILAVPVVLVLVGAGLWFGGILPPLLGMGKAADHAEADHKPAADAHGAKPPAAAGHGAPAATGHGAPAADAGHGAKPPAKADAPAVAGPLFVELPDIVSNLNTGGRRAVYVKLKSRIELARPADEAVLKAAMPRVLDLFQTYLREMRPEEMRGSAGTYRLREELIARANIAVAPARIQDLLFTEILIQ